MEQKSIYFSGIRTDNHSELFSTTTTAQMSNLFND